MLDNVVFNETPGCINVDAFVIFPGDCLELTTKQLAEFKKLYPGFVQMIDEGRLTVYDSKADLDTIEARLKGFSSFMKAKRLPKLDRLPGEKMTTEQVSLYGARLKRRYLETKQELGQ